MNHSILSSTVKSWETIAAITRHVNFIRIVNAVTDHVVKIVRYHFNVAAEFTIVLMKELGCGICGKLGSQICEVESRVQGLLGTFVKLSFLSYQIRAKGSLCRDKVNDCDLPEYCDGETTYVSLEFKISEQ